MIKIIIVGGTQCGSTRLFNFIRIIFERKGMKVLSRWINDIKENKEDYDVVLIKAHDMDLGKCKEYDVVILPYRDIRDVYISTVTRWGFKKDIIGEMMINLRLFRKFLKVADVLYKYENYGFNYNRKIVDKIVGGIGWGKGRLEISDEEIAYTMKELDYMHNNIKVRFDNFENKEYREKLMCKKHNTSGGKSEKWRTYFSAEDNRKIIMNKDIRGFLKKRGYNLK